MVLTLRRIITQVFGSDKVEQVEIVHRTGAERAAQREESDARRDGPLAAETSSQADLRPDDAPAPTQPR